MCCKLIPHETLPGSSVQPEINYEITNIFPTNRNSRYMEVNGHHSLYLKAGVKRFRIRNIEQGKMIIRSAYSLQVPGSHKLPD